MKKLLGISLLVLSLTTQALAEEVWSKYVKSNKDSDKVQQNKPLQAINFQAEIKNFSGDVDIQFPVYSLHYIKETDTGHWGLGFGMSLNEKAVNNPFKLTDGSSSIPINKLSYFGIGGGFVHLDRWYVDCWADFNFFKSPTTNSGINGLSLNINFGKPLPVNKQMLIPYMGIGFSSISNATMNGRSGKLDSSFNGFILNYGVKWLIKI